MLKFLLILLVNYIPVKLKNIRLLFYRTSPLIIFEIFAAVDQSI